MVDAVVKNPLPRWLHALPRHRTWILLSLTLLFVTVVRVRLREMPLERDEGEYAYAGQLILQGIPPYQEVYNMKLPGTYAAYALILAVFGQTPSGIHLGLTLVNLASIIFVFLLGRRMLDDDAGVAAAATFALLSLSPTVLGLAGHATHFVALFALGGLLLLMRAYEGRRLGGRRHRSKVTGQKSEPEQSPPNPFVSSVQSVVKAVRLSTTNHPLSTLFASGLLFGLAFLMKQHGIFFAVFALLYPTWIWLKARADAQAPRHPRSHRRHSRFLNQVAAERTAVPSVSSVTSVKSLAREEEPPPASQLSFLKALAKDLSVLSAGLVLPYLVTCLILWWAGVFPQFWFWTVTYAATYASAVSWEGGEQMLQLMLRNVAGPNVLLWILSVAGAVVVWYRRPLRTNHRFLVTCFLLCSVVTVVPGFYFRAHYFITLLPALALLAGVSVSRGLHLMRRDRNIEVLRALPFVFLLAAGLGVALIGQSALWFTMSPEEASREIYRDTLFLETAKAAEYIKANAAKDARIVVLGSEPEIFFNARRRSGTGHIYMYPLMEVHGYASKMQQAAIAEIERSRPEYVVYLDDDFSWLRQVNSERKLDQWWDGYWPANLDLVMTRELVLGQEPDLVSGMFGRRQADTGPVTLGKLLIYKRKADNAKRL